MSPNKKTNSFVRIWLPFIILAIVAIIAFLIIKNAGTQQEMRESARLPLLNYRVNISQDTIIDKLTQFSISVLFSNTADTSATNIEARFYFIYSDPPVEQYRQILLAEVDPQGQNMIRFREYIPSAYDKDFYSVLKVKYKNSGLPDEPLHTDYRYYRYDPSGQVLVDIRDKEGLLKKVVDNSW